MMQAQESISDLTVVPALVLQHAPPLRPPHRHDGGDGNLQDLQQRLVAPGRKRIQRRLHGIGDKLLKT
eukprot:748122-Hanusia_phi.AAC.1